MEVFRDGSIVLADHIADMGAMTAEADKAKRRKKYLLILQLILLLRRRSAQQLLLLLTAAARKANNRISQSNFPNPERGLLTDDQLRALAETQTAEAEGYLARALLAVQALASGLQNQRGAQQRLASFAGLPARAAADSATIRKRLRERLIVIRGSDGKNRSYEPGSYAELVLRSEIGNLSKQVVLRQCELLDTDLIQISPNPSTIGDWCDEYAGKVFSISGTSSAVLPLAIVPGGGAPMHLRCTHWMVPFSADGYSDDELGGMSQLPEPFLELGRQGADANAYTRAWKRIQTA